MTTHSPIPLNCLILPRRQPEFNAWKIQADPDDLSEMFEILQIAGVVPTKVPIARAVDKRAYRIGPTRIGQAGEPFLHRCPDPRKQVPAAQRIAGVANGFRDQLQKATDAASSRRQRI